ncbi:unnamed protein product [Chrysoparadoxa australica]
MIELHEQLVSELEANKLELQKALGGTDEAIALRERRLYLQAQIHGSATADVERDAADLVLAYNTLAMAKLQTDCVKEAARLLAKAHLLTGRTQTLLVDTRSRLQLRAITLNNLGCLYKKWGKPRVALKFLDRALTLESRHPTLENPAGTHLNMSACYGTIGMHKDAAKHALKAIYLLEQPSQSGEDTNNTSIPQREAKLENEAGGGQHNKSGAKDGDGGCSNSTSLLAVAYFNLAAEQEHLQRLLDAASSYETAIQVARRELGSDHAMTRGLQKAAANSRQKSKERARNARRAQERKDQNCTTYSTPRIGMLKLYPQVMILG